MPFLRHDCFSSHIRALLIASNVILLFSTVSSPYQRLPQSLTVQNWPSLVGDCRLPLLYYFIFDFASFSKVTESALSAAATCLLCQAHRRFKYCCFQSLLFWCLGVPTMNSPLVLAGEG